MQHVASKVKNSLQCYQLTVKNLRKILSLLMNCIHFYPLKSQFFGSNFSLIDFKLEKNLSVRIFLWFTYCAILPWYSQPTKKDFSIVHLNPVHVLKTGFWTPFSTVLQVWLKNLNNAKLQYIRSIGTNPIIININFLSSHIHA